MHSETKMNLAKSYDNDAARRAQAPVPEWKAQERSNYLTMLINENKKEFLEIGAGTGKDGLFFQESGLNVTCVDLSEEMVRHCLEKGLNAKVMDFYHLEFPDGSFDAVYAINSLLHVPKKDLGEVLLEIRKVLKPDGLFYLGVYGGRNSEEIWEQDWCEPKRLFSFFEDEAIQEFVGTYFDILYFKSILMESDIPRFQSMILRKTASK